MFTSFAALFVSILPHPIPTAASVQSLPPAERAVSSWSAPVESAYVAAGDRLDRCDIRIGAGALVELAIRDVSASRPGQSPEPDSWLTTNVLGLSVVGAVDLVDLPGGDLLAGFTVIVGASHRLALVRVRTESTSDGRVVRRVVASTSLGTVDVLVPVAGGERRMQPADLFDSAAILVGPSGVSVFAGARLPGRLVSKMESAIVQIAFDESLQSIRGASVVADGSDPRVRATPGGFVLGARQPRDGEEVAASSDLILLGSSDGSTWSARASVLGSPRVRWDYALAVAGRNLRVSTPTDDPLVGVTWSLAPDGGEWRLDDTFDLALDESAGRGVRVWSPRSRIGEPGSGRVVVRSTVGLVRR